MSYIDFVLGYITCIMNIIIVDIVINKLKSNK